MAQLEEGGFLDSATEQVRARLVTYNSPLRHFGALAVTFRRGSGGEFAVEAAVQAARVELYSRPVDKLRLAAEVAASFAVLLWLWKTAADMARAPPPLAPPRRPYLHAWRVAPVGLWETSSFP